MKKVLHLLPVGISLLCTSARAQKANIDSLELVAQISQDQLKLGKLQKPTAKPVPALQSDTTEHQ